MIQIRVLETIDEMEQLEALQRLVWPGSETDILPAHVLLTFAHNGGLVLGAYENEQMVGLSVGFPGLYKSPDGIHFKHCSHELGVHPDYRDAGIGFLLKRTQWQMVRQQGLDLVTWTYDPLLSRNAQLNIARLGAVCNTYLPNLYGEMRDGLNVGLASDRFQVDWWINTLRVKGKFEHLPQPRLSHEHYVYAQAQSLYQTTFSPDACIRHPDKFSPPGKAILLAEIPSDFLNLKMQDYLLAKSWRSFSRDVFQTCFAHGYLVTDFIYKNSPIQPRSFYVLTHGNSTLMD